MVNSLLRMTDFDRLFLGFDRMKHELANHGTTGNYPRYNIIKGKLNFKIFFDGEGFLLSEIVNFRKIFFNHGEGLQLTENVKFWVF